MKSHLSKLEAQLLHELGLQQLADQEEPDSLIAAWQAICGGNCQPGWEGNERL